MSNSTSATSPRGGSITLLTWNVRGLRTNLKRGKVFSHLRSLSGDIIFLQETHITHSDRGRLRCSWISQVFQSTFSSKARGVAILVRQNIPFEHISTVSDPDGRYLIVSGRIESRHYTFLNIYAPNFDNPGFFRKVFNLIPDLSATHLIAAGDYNAILDIYTDRLSTRPTTPSNCTITLNNLIRTMNLVDIWRLQHPTDKEYSFFSHPHKSYTRIDYFLTDARLTADVLHTKYHNILISDHSPVELKIRLNTVKPQYSWRFNPLLLNDKPFFDQTAKKITEYFSENDTTDVSDSTLWEAFKAVMRGHFIAYEAKLKKDRQKRLTEITTELSSLEKVYKETASSLTLNNIMKLKFEYNSILSNHVSKMILKMQQKHFELNDKPDSLLARQLKGLQAKRAIHKIKTNTGNVTTDPIEINECFSDFYKELYTSKITSDVSQISDFLSSLNLPKLNTSARETLNANFTLGEITEAIRSFPNGKAAGPDGFGIEFYKAYVKLISPFLLRMFNYSVKEGILPESLYAANISLILKKGKDDTDPASYRPIALLGCDLKIFTKILANRLNKCISTIIHQDQTGFIPGRFSFFNVRRLMNVMYSDYDKESKTAILALDARKAFDQVEWKYILTVMKEFDLGDNFTAWVKMLYARPTASVITNSNKSSPFLLQRSCRQGCPLSPLLFAIALEPLAISIRNHPSISPVHLGEIDHHISLYADDVVLFVSHPERSVPSLLELINTFGGLSGYTINWDKSEFMLLNGKVSSEFLKSLPFRTAVNQIEYLGLTIPKDPKLIYKANYLKAVEKLKSNIETWRLLPLSMIGRVNAIKMVTLPRLLYLFQNLPIFLPMAYFKLLDSTIMPFIWGYKAHRISKKHITKPKDVGGLSLPNFRHYYWAANARALMYWTDAYPDETTDLTPSWLAIEKNVSNTSLPALLFSTPMPLASISNNNFLVKQSVKIWYQIRKTFKLPEISAYTPIRYNHAFPPSLIKNNFSLWYNRGIFSLSDLYIDKIFASFAQLQEIHILPTSHFFRYLQVRDYTRRHIPDFESTPPPSHSLYATMNQHPSNRSLVSQLVNFFTSYETPPTQHLKEAWERDLAITIDNESWELYLEDIRN